MPRGLIAKLRRDRRAAAAVIIALMSVPMILAAGAAIDFSRIAAARAQLQSAADSAALAGAGAFETNLDGTVAYNVAKTAFNASAATLSAYAGTSSTVGTLCNPGGVANITCGTTSAANGASARCPATTIYCVQVTAQATLRNSLLGFAIPSDVLNVTSVAQSLGGGYVSASNFNHTVLTYGSDLTNIYAYSVPTDSAGNPIYSSVPTPNSYCSSSSYGVLQYVPTLPAANGTTGCNYVLIGTNGGASNSGGLNFQDTDPLAFTFVDFTGGSATAVGDLDTTSYSSLTGIVVNTGTATHYTSEVYVTAGGGTSYNANGFTAPGLAGLLAGPLYGTCPAHNLYGSINAYPNASPSQNIVPYQDSINIFSSAWEALGLPPTHGTNHALLPFLGPANTETVGGTSYTVRAVCPQWPTDLTSIKATASFTPSNLPAGYAPVANTPNFPAAANVNVYATYYPDVAYSSGTGSGVYPPPIAGCSPTASLTDGGVTPLTDLAWWGWSPSNALQMDPGGAAENPGGLAEANCTSAVLNSTGTLIVAVLNALQSPAYDNCALLIQPLGTAPPMTNGVPNLPDYYTYKVGLLSFILPSVGAILNSGNTATGNASSIINSATPPLSGMTPVYDGRNGDTHAAGYVPSSVSISGPLLGPYVITEPPAYGTDYYPPEDTSHQCYNPQAGSIASPTDPVENPQYGVVFCNTNPPQNFALYWNDMGAWATPPGSNAAIGQYNDDLGYNNAITEVTCPIPGSPGATGPPTLIY